YAGRAAGILTARRAGATSRLRLALRDRWPVLVVAGCLVAALAGMSGRYGYHRDELYFLAAGRHLAWGYPDQPPLVPLLAKLLSGLAPGSMVALRLPSALVAGGVVLLTAAMTRQLGGGRSAQLLAAGPMAVSAAVLAAGRPSV